MPDLNERYEAQLQKAIAVAQKRIRKIYEQSILELSVKAGTVNSKDQPFSLSLYPLLNKQIEAKVRDMHKSLYRTIVDSVAASWNLSNAKNNEIIDKRLAGKNPSKKVKQILYDPNKGALDQFLTRKEKGLDLSQRVWNTLEPFKKEMEQSLGMAINEGKSATKMATQLQRYLNDPEALFRRVKGNDGKLHLSKNARTYKPGQGVYRSSYKNALRLSRTENNIAYRAADHERWKELPFITGIEVKLSKSHPMYDICDQVKGKYPKDFKFTGWHPQCLCYATPVQMGDEDYDKLEDSILGLREFDPQSVEQVSAPPAGFTNYVTKNRERMEGWKNKPYWMRDNGKYLIGQPKPAPLKKEAPKLFPAGKAVKPQLPRISGDIRGPVEHALAAIDEVHGDGVLDDIPFYPVKSDVFNAAFYFHPTTKKALRIDLSTTSKNQALSIAHEMGHYFDLQSIGRKGSMATAQSSSPLTEVLEIAEKTDAIKTMIGYLQNRSIVQDGQRLPLTKKAIETLEYLLDPAEIWARAYAQFIANRSSSVAMKDQLKKLLVNHPVFKVQWEQNDFAALEKAIEKMMIDLGWIISR